MRGSFVFLAAFLLVAPLAAQAPASLSFDVVSVRPSTSGQPASNVPLGPGNVFSPTGGFLRARNFPLLTYIDFAYRSTSEQEASLAASAPAWVREDLFTIEARTDNTAVTKDQMRLMMRTLLADRFKLTIHREMRETRVYALLQIKPDTLGPRLRTHPATATCANFAPAAPATGGKAPDQPVQTSPGDFPVICGGILGLQASAQDRYSFGAANILMPVIAKSFSSWGNLGRPVVDRTGLEGPYDFVLDFTPDPRPAYATEDSGGPTFQQALQQQLGLKLEPQKAAVEFLVLDHVEHPTEN